jgi:hypothetical protein
MGAALTLQNDLPQGGVLSGPFDVAPAADGIRPTAATVDLVQGQVQALLAATPSYHALAPPERARLSSDLTRISAYAAECLRDICWQSRQLGQTPVVKRTREVATPLARAQGDDFKPQAAGQIARITEQTLKAVAFPTFVADLIRGTFDAIVRTSIQQMEAFVAMVSNVSKTVDQFMADNISDLQARDWLASRYPEHIRIQNQQAVPAPGADEKPPPDFRRELHLDNEVSLDESAIEEVLVPAARRKLAETRLQMLSTLALMGVNRIIVTGGKIRATMGFHIDTTDRAHQEHASDFDFRTAAAGSFGFGPWSASASMSLSYVSSSRSSSDQEINVDTDLTGEVELHFKSDYFPLQRFAGTAQMQTIRGNTAAPESNPLPEAKAEPFAAPPEVGGTVGRYTSPRSRRTPAQPPKLRAIGEPLPPPRMPDKPMDPDALHAVRKEETAPDAAKEDKAGKAEKVDKAEKVENTEQVVKTDKADTAGPQEPAGEKPPGAESEAGHEAVTHALVRRAPARTEWSTPP